jgi:thiol-disulfide isomerase/thioredoxin
MEDVSESGNFPSLIPVEVNFPAPELNLTHIDGSEVSLQDHRGKVILVNNWATWCPPCKAEMPTLQAFYQEYVDKGFVLVAIEAGEPAEEVIQFVENYGITFPVWLDPSNLALTAFRNSALPSSYVIDQDGIVRLAWSGAINRSTLEQYVTPLLEE